MNQPQKPPKQPSEDDVLRRMLNTPPTLHKPKAGATKRPNKATARSKGRKGQP